MICQCLVHQDLSARQRQITIFCQPRPIIVNYFSHNIPIFLSPTNWSLPSSKDPHFQNETKCTTFHVRFICMRMKIISISKAEHLTSFWYGGLGGTRKWPIHGTVEPPFRRDTQDQDRCPLNTGVHSIEVTDTRLYELASGGAGGTMCDLNDGVPRINVSQKRGFIVKWQRNIKFCLKMQIFLFPQIRLDSSVG